MTAPRRRIEWTPLTMTFVEVAEVVFRRGESWLREHIGDYPTFPTPDPGTGLYLAEQVNDWLRARYGIVPSSSAGLTDLAMERAKHGARPRAISRS